MNDRPIGVFDSGFGGLTVARAVIDLLPEEDLVYIGDTGRYPYGPRPLDEVRTFAQQIATKLVAKHHAKLIVVACNTAAAAGLEGLRGSIDVPVVSVIEPGLRAALRATVSGRIAVIGTVGTIGSGAYQRALALMAEGDGVELTCAACPGFVEFVERGETRLGSGLRAGRAPPGAGPRRQSGHPPPGLHPLSVPGPHHQRRHGP